MNAAKIRPIVQYYAIERVLMAHPDGILPRELAYQTHLSLTTITAWLYRLRRLGSAEALSDGRWRGCFQTNTPLARRERGGGGMREEPHEPFLDRRDHRLHRRIRFVMGDQRPRGLGGA